MPIMREGKTASEESQLSPKVEGLRNFVREGQRNPEKIEALQKQLELLEELGDTAREFREALEHVDHEAATGDDQESNYRYLLQLYQSLQEKLRGAPKEIEI